jgi:hypothetical protein
VYISWVDFRSSKPALVSRVIEIPTYPLSSFVLVEFNVIATDVGIKLIFSIFGIQEAIFPSHFEGKVISKPYSLLLKTVESFEGFVSIFDSEQENSDILFKNLLVDFIRNDNYQRLIELLI